MIHFISGTIFGIIVATIGFEPIAAVLDSGMIQLQNYAAQRNVPVLPEPVEEVSTPSF